MRWDTPQVSKYEQGFSVYMWNYNIYNVSVQYVAEFPSFSM